MTHRFLLYAFLLVLAFSTAACGQARADQVPVTTGATVTGQAPAASAHAMDAVVAVQEYNRAIHVMVMLLLGFGFLMVFVRGYGLSALTATYMLTAVSLPLYIWLKGAGLFGEPVTGIHALITAEFGAASLLICAGAVLGRLKMPQYLLLGVLFIPLYMLNEWIVLEGGLGLVGNGVFVDTGGSIVIHMFGALFGLGVAMAMTTVREREIAVESDFTSDRFSLLGSMALWVFWPSFCAALVPAALVPQTAMNVVMALCGSTLLTYFATMLLRRGIAAADIANATLAGGVAIGSTCDKVSLSTALVIGAVAGFASTFGFAVIQDRLQKGLKLVDTCGVSNLHGIPGLLGGLAALLTVAGIDGGTQLKGIAVTIVIAVIAGLIVGRIVALAGRRARPYEDDEEFLAG